MSHFYPFKLAGRKKDTRHKQNTNTFNIHWYSNIILLHFSLFLNALDRITISVVTNLPLNFPF